MSLLAKFRKKKGAEEPKQPLKSPVALLEPAPKPPPPEVVENEPQGHAVEIDSSIFSGLVLSGKVTTKEDSSSPYLQKKTTPQSEDSDPTSSFNFLRKKPADLEPLDDDTKEEEEEGTSLFSFLKSPTAPVDDEQPGSGFSFLNQAPTESKDPEQPSHEESHDSPTKRTQSRGSSQDKLHTEREEPQSPDNVSISSDRTNDSAHSEGRVIHMVPKQQPPSSGKKKKRRALRPGQAAKTEEQPSNVLIEEKDTQVHTPPTVATSDSVDKTSSKERIATSEAMDTTPVQPVKEEIMPEELIESKTSKEEQRVEEEPQEHTSDGDKTDSIDGPVKQDSLDKEPETQELVNLTDNTEEPQESSAPVETIASDLADVFTVESANYEVELSAQEELVTLLESFESGLQKIRLGVEQAKEEHQVAVEEQMTLTRGQIERRQKVKELTEQEAKALSEEDYELAEKLSHELEETQLFQEDKIVGICLKAIEQWMLKCCDVAESEMSFRKDIHNQLTTLRSDHSKTLSEMEKELSSLQSKDKMRLKTMEDKIERERGHIALDKEHLEKSEQGLSEELNRRAAGFIASKEKLQEQLRTVESEISELEAKLVALRNQRSDIQQNISEEEEKIQSIQTELAEEHSELYAERKQIEQRESQLAKEVDKFTLECNAVEAVHNDQERKRQSLVQLVEKVDSQCSEYAGIEQSLSQCNKVMDTLIPLLEKGKAMLKPTSQLNSILEQCSNKSKEVDEITTQLLASQAELTSLRKKVVEWETQLPQLSDAKKAAVTGRQFKEASRLAGEIKEVTSSLEQEKGNISKIEEELSSSNKQLSQLSDELTALKEQTSSLEKEEDEQHIQHLLDVSKEIRSHCGAVENTAFYEAVEQWCQLNQLLCVSLSAKHGLELSAVEPPPSELETPEKSTVTDEVPEERTPGVDKEDNSEQEEKKQELKTRLAQIESEIEKAVEEENFDKAADLDDEMKEVQKQLDELQ